MDNFEREKMMQKALNDKNYDEAISHASKMPPNWNTFSRMPSFHPEGMPEEHVRKVLDLLTHKYGQHRSQLPNFLYEYSQNIPKNASPDILNHVAKVLTKEYPEDTLASKKIIEHPNWQPDEETKSLQDAGNFWTEYEKRVEPHHFAAIKSMFTGKPEELTDHRGGKGRSQDYAHLIPHLRLHAQKVQERIMKDDNIKKRYFGGKPYIKLYRGVRGNYGEAIHKAVGFNPASKTIIKDKKFSIPTAHLSSWTIDPHIATGFAARAIFGGQSNTSGVVLSQWLPVESVLHSGMPEHATHIGKEFPHPIEKEIVVGHPEGKMKISTSDMKFQTHEGQGTFATPKKQKSEDVIKSEQLEKAHSKMASAITALAMLGAPHSVDSLEYKESPEMHQVQRATEIKSPKNTDAAPGLRPILRIESQDNTNRTHKLMTYGPHAGTSAYGGYGLMPMQIIDTLNYDKKLKNNYPELASLHFKDNQDQIKSFLDKNPQLEKQIANSHWNRLYHRFNGDRSRMAYAWKNGIRAALNADDEEINDHPYVKAYHKYDQLLNLEKPQELIQKSESHADPSKIEEFLPFTETPKDSLEMKTINASIKSGNVHNLSNVGHFTHDSFLAGFTRDNSWLIKIESISRPGIKSAREGLQSVKEVAFYHIANRVFNLGQFTPKAILGEVVRDGKRWPAAAIKMYPEQYVSSVQLEKQKPGSVRGIIEKYRKNGQLHKLAIMLYILGEADAHGGNMLTNGIDIKLIDHGTSFADSHFAPESDKDIFIPYMLRAGVIKDKWTKEEKLAKMPKIDNEAVRQEVKHWVFTISAEELLKELNKYFIDPEPTLQRLKLVQKLMAHSNEPDEVINQLWVIGHHANEEKDGIN
jgi:hypothetical protein